MSSWKVEIFDAAKPEIDVWPVELRAALSRIFDRIEALGIERIREPLAKHIEGRLWELRPSGKRVEGRALYVTVTGRRVVVVLAFIKKTQKTPRSLIALASKRAELVK